MSTKIQPDLQNQNPQQTTIGIRYEHTESESCKSKLIKWTLWLTRAKHLLAYNYRRIINNNKPSESWNGEAPKYISNNFEVTSWQVDGRQVFKIAPKTDKTKKQVLFLHGGAYSATITS